MGTVLSKNLNVFCCFKELSVALPFIMPLCSAEQIFLSELQNGSPRLSPTPPPHTKKIILKIIDKKNPVIFQAGMVHSSLLWPGTDKREGKIEINPTCISKTGTMFLSHFNHTSTRGRRRRNYTLCLTLGHKCVLTLPVLWNGLKEETNEGLEGSIKSLYDLEQISSSKTVCSGY